MCFPANMKLNMADICLRRLSEVKSSRSAKRYARRFKDRPLCRCAIPNMAFFSAVARDNFRTWEALAVLLYHWLAMVNMSLLWAQIRFVIFLSNAHLSAFCSYTAVDLLLHVDLLK